jgi:hypothetical protein
MNRKPLACLAALPLFAFGCSGSTVTDNPDGGSGSGSGSSSGGSSTASNVAPLIVDSGPAGVEGSVDVPFVTVTLCVPGTTTCQTIDHVSVDTGSSGMRVISSVLSAGMTLPQVDAADGNPLAECLQFQDGYVWGNVRYADVKIAGEVAGKIPIQVIGDPAFPDVPTTCSSSGSSDGSTVAEFGANGLLGLNQIVPDCGDYCASGSATGQYYSCSGGTCTDTTEADADQISNPIAFFARDNNGAIMQFGAVPANGAATLAGTLTLGIGTQSNNGLGSAKVQTLDVNGNFSTSFGGATFATSYVDSGTNTLSFNDTSIAGCTSQQSSGFDCPTSPVMLTATNTGGNSVSATVSFSVESADTLFATNNTAFDDLATPGVDNDTFAWGFPFFIGRSVFIGLQGRSAGGTMGPLVAY